VVHGRVIGGSEPESLLRQPPAGCAAQSAVAALQFFNEDRVIGHARNDRHVLEVFGRRAHHRWAADVNVLDQMTKCDAGLRGGFLKSIEIHNHHVDRLNAVRGDCGLVLGVAANVEQAAVNLGVEGLDAAVEHLGKAGQFADVFDSKAGLAQSARRPAS
jgi:hypothetical protein